MAVGRTLMLLGWIHSTKSASVSPHSIFHRSDFFNSIGSTCAHARKIPLIHVIRSVQNNEEILFS